MKRIGALLLILTIANAHAAGPRVQFPRFKFQPNKTYEIEIFHKNVISFKFNDDPGTGTAPGGKKAKDAEKELQRGVIPAENQVLFKATLRTSAVTKKNVMPLKMRMNAFNTLIKSGNKTIPQKDAALNDLKGKEFLAELDQWGAIREVGASPAPASGTGESSGMFDLFSLIPLFPAGDFGVGAEFYTDSQGRLFAPGAKPGAWVFKYTIVRAAGDSVRIESVDRSRLENEKSGKADPLTGSRGEIVYLSQRKMFSFAKLNTVSTSEPEKEDLKGKGVVVNNWTFWVKVDEVK